MIYNGKEIEFPAISQISFFKLIETLEVQAKGDDIGLALYAKELLKLVEANPELKEGFSDLRKLETYKTSINKLSRALFPDTLLTNEIKILTPPFQFIPFYTSTRFDNIVKSSGGNLLFTMRNVDEDIFYLYCCYFIMTKYYGFPVNAGIPQMLEIKSENQNLTRMYKLLINADLIEFIPTDKAIEITKKDYEELLDNFWDLALWKKKFPPNSWIMRGVNLVNLVDVTQDQSITDITSNLLVKSEDGFEKIRNGIRRLLNNASLEIGVLSINNDELSRIELDDMNSILLKQGEKMTCNINMCEHTYGILLKQREALVIVDTEEFHKNSQTDFSSKILASGYGSYIITPLLHEGDNLGFIELGAKNTFELNQGSIAVLNEILPILAMAKKRFMTEAQNQVEAIIQQECTTIHSSVKWRFEEEAQKFIQKQLNKEQAVFKDIIFNNLYPLYGQMDIKDSSERRNKAVSTDLIKQISAVKKVLRAVNAEKTMPIYEELIFRIDNFKKELSRELSAGTEHKIMAFLNSDIYPVFNYLEAGDRSIKALIEEYKSLLDPELNTVYEARKKYDNNVNQINQRLASFLDEKQVSAQEIFPHYFERYKTDGVEFNIYIGQSITKSKTFDNIYLKNLRLWQLLVMCEMENEFKSMQKELGTPIEMASLILVYSTPLSVHFRMDEKQFDVEGAYNARYEIIKKRVDKSKIKGTDERITRPRSLAIIYSQESDAQEYKTYLSFLEAKGLIKPDYEDLELEDLQGVHGLRALRANFVYSDNMNVDKLLREIEEKSLSSN